MNHLSRLAALSVLALALSSPAAIAAGDAAAGKAKAASCVACHQPGSFPGKSEAAIAAGIKAIVEGKAAHPPVGQPSAQDIADMAAFFASGG